MGAFRGIKAAERLVEMLKTGGYPVYLNTVFVKTGRRHPTQENKIRKYAGVRGIGKGNELVTFKSYGMDKFQS